MIRVVPGGDFSEATKAEQELLAGSVDEETRPADGYTVPDSVRRPLAREWEGYTDGGGDTAYLAEVGDETVMVYGSAPADDLHTIIDALTRAELRS